MPGVVFYDSRLCAIYGQTNTIDYGSKNSRHPRVRGADWRRRNRHDVYLAGGLPGGPHDVAEVPRRGAGRPGAAVRRRGRGTPHHPRRHHAGGLPHLPNHEERADGQGRGILPHLPGRHHPRDGGEIPGGRLAELRIARPRRPAGRGGADGPALHQGHRRGHSPGGLRHRHRRRLPFRGVPRHE